MRDVVVIAGTVDSRDIVNELLLRNWKVTATVATDFGHELLGQNSGLHVLTGRLNLNEMVELLKRIQPKCLIDASHPFAAEVSKNAGSACGIAGIPYIRYERESIMDADEQVYKVKSFEAAAEQAAVLNGNILLTVGSNNLGAFVEKIPNYKERVFARVLPDSKVLLKCEAAGLTAQNIIAIKGPFSEEMNIEMIKHCNASVLITKESGKEGGVLEKLRACKKMGVSIVLIERPEVVYMQKVSTKEEVMDWVEKYV